jgi:hypothetical protein
VIVGNSSLALKPAAPTGAMLRLLKEKGVGIVLIGMDTIDSMAPVGKLDVGMKEHLLKTKDMRFAPAWIWGMSDMRALTAAIAEKEVFQPRKAIATGGSKRGVATAAAGIADDRFTAIMPVVAPIIDSPGGPYVEGMMPADIEQRNAEFFEGLTKGDVGTAPASAHDPLLNRQKVRAFERITLQEARGAGWDDQEIKDACSLAWEVSRMTNYLPAVRKRGLEFFYNEGSNDNVSPGLRRLGQLYPDFPIYVVPGGQHGGAKGSGVTRSVGGWPPVDENLYALSQHHFFQARPMVAAPKVETQWDQKTQHLHVTVLFPDGAEPQKNDLWWSVDRNPDYTMAMEYDQWQSIPMQRTGPAAFAGDVLIATKMKDMDFVTVHQHEANGSTLTLSSPLLRVEKR